MEQNEEGIENTNTDLFQEDSMTLSGSGLIYIKETASWAKFLSIIGFIFIGLMVIFSLFAGSLFNQFPDEISPIPFPGFLFGAIYLLIAILYFFPVYYLYKFSANVKNAIASKDSQALESGLENLKSHYKFLGIFTIIFLGIYILIILFAITIGFMF